MVLRRVNDSGYAATARSQRAVNSSMFANGPRHSSGKMCYCVFGGTRKSIVDQLPSGHFSEYRKDMHPLPPAQWRVPRPSPSGSRGQYPHIRAPFRGRALSPPVAGGTLLHTDRAASAHQVLCRHLEKCGKNPTMERVGRLRPRRHLQETAQQLQRPLHNATNVAWHYSRKSILIRSLRKEKTLSTTYAHVSDCSRSINYWNISDAV